MAKQSQGKSRSRTRHNRMMGYWGSRPYVEAKRKAAEQKREAEREEIAQNRLDWLAGAVELPANVELDWNLPQIRRFVKRNHGTRAEEILDGLGISYDGQTRKTVITVPVWAKGLEAQLQGWNLAAR